MSETYDAADLMEAPPNREETQALTVPRECPTGPVVPVTPAQARIEAVASVLDAAYSRASALVLTRDESTGLEADFPDEAFSLGAGGDANLVYIEHAYLRRRLNQVLGLGASVPIRRREWAEEYEYFKDGRAKKAVRVYVDMVLIVRGCVVGEAIADSVYYPDNAKSNYSDALEGAASNAFRRCCKIFGVGLQPWMRGWCAGWKDRQRAGQRPQGAPASGTTIPPQVTRPEPTQVKPEAPKEAKAPIVATATTRTWMLKQLAGIDARTLKEFAESRAILLPNETLEEWPLNQVPTSREGLAKLVQEIQDFQVPPPPAEAPALATLPPEAFWGVICPIPRAGMKRDEYLLTPDTIRSLYDSAKAGDATARARLFGLAQDWKPEPREFNGKTIQPTEHEHTFRLALDQFMAWRAARPKTTKPTEQP